MLILAIIAILVLGSIAGYIQWMYANANYPQSWKWKITLFLSGVGVGAIAMALLPIQDLPLLKQAVVIIGVGLFNGYGLLVLFPKKMQTIVPKKDQ